MKLIQKQLDKLNNITIEQIEKQHQIEVDKYHPEEDGVMTVEGLYHGVTNALTGNILTKNDNELCKASGWIFDENKDTCANCEYVKNLSLRCYEIPDFDKLKNCRSEKDVLEAIQTYRANLTKLIKTKELETLIKDVKNDFDSYHIGFNQKNIIIELQIKKPAVKEYSDYIIIQIDVDDNLQAKHIDIQEQLLPANSTTGEVNCVFNAYKDITEKNMRINIDTDTDLIVPTPVIDRTTFDKIVKIFNNSNF